MHKQHAAKRHKCEQQVLMLCTGMAAGKQVLDAIDRGELRCPTNMAAHAAANAVQLAVRALGVGTAGPAGTS